MFKNEFKRLDNDEINQLKNKTLQKLLDKLNLSIISTTLNTRLNLNEENS